MDSASAPGLDDFTCYFFQKYWNILGLDVASVIDFFRTKEILRNLNSNFIVLLPKVEEANSVEQLHPIALGKFFKVITKIISKRLETIASRVISSSQFGFDKGRQIQDAIVRA